MASEANFYSLGYRFIVFLKVAADANILLECKEMIIHF